VSEEDILLKDKKAVNAGCSSNCLDNLKDKQGYTKRRDILYWQNEAEDVEIAIYFWSKAELMLACRLSSTNSRHCMNVALEAPL